MACFWFEDAGGIELSAQMSVAWLWRSCWLYLAYNGAMRTRVIDAGYVVKLPDDIDSDLAASIMLKGLTVAYLIHDSYAVDLGIRCYSMPQLVLA